MLYPESFTDVATNHKLIKRKVLNKLNLVSKGFTLDFEISLKLAKYKFRCDEISIEYYPRTYKEGKKINFMDQDLEMFCVTDRHLNFFNDIKYKLAAVGKKNSIQSYNL